MKLITTIPLTLLSAITLLPSTSAWKFTWRDGEGNDTTESGKGPHACTKIQHAEGEEFAWNNQGNQDIGIYLYSSSDCSGSLAGWSSNIWKKESSRDLLSFKVANEGATTTADVTTTESHTGSADATKTATATALTSGGASNSTVSGSSSAVESKTKTKADTSATTSSSPASSNTASGSTAENTGSSATATGGSGSRTPSSTASATDGASTDESSASSLSKHNAAIAVAGLVLGVATFEWVI